MTQHTQVGHGGKSHSVLSPDPATKSLRDLWQVAASALGLSFPIYTPKVLDSMSSGACYALTGCGVKAGDRAGWPGYGAAPPRGPGTYPVKDVVKAVRAGDIEAEEKDTGVGVEEGPQAVIVNLPWGEWGWALPSDLPQHQGGHPSRWGSPDQGVVVCLVVWFKCGAWVATARERFPPGSIPLACPWAVLALVWVRPLAERALFW